MATLAVVVTPSASASDGAGVLVTLKPNVAAKDVANAHKASIKGEAPGLGIALMVGNNQADLIASLKTDSRVAYAEPDRLVRSLSYKGDADQDSTKQSGVGWNGVGWSGAGWDGVGWEGVGWSGAGWAGAGWAGVGWAGVGWDGVGWAASGFDLLNSTYGSAPLPAWGLYATGAAQVHPKGIPQHNRVVCVVDSGVDYKHPALQANLWKDSSGAYGYNFVQNNKDVMDDGGHGTHMVGIIAASTSNGLGFRGVGAPLVASAKVLNGTGYGKTSDLVKGIDWCTSIKANVMLLALSEDSPTEALKTAVEKAVASGMLVVAASGNGGCSNCVSYPAAYTNVVAVSAISHERRLANFSSTGPQVAITAPGEFIVSAYPGGMARVGSGTSQAAAFAAGSAALFWGKVPSWSAGRVAEHFGKTATDLGPAGKDDLYGYGLIDLQAAYRAAGL